MTSLTSITNAVSSSDAATIMQGYVDTLACPDSPDRRNILAFLLAKIPASSGNLDLTERIAINAYDTFGSSSLERIAMSRAYRALLEPVKASGNLELAEHIARNACDMFHATSSEKLATYQAYRSLSKLATDSGNVKLRQKITECPYTWHNPSEWPGAGQGASSEVTLFRIAETIQQIHAHKAPTADNLGRDSATSGLRAHLSRWVRGLPGAIFRQH